MRLYTAAQAAAGGRYLVRPRRSRPGKQRKFSANCGFRCMRVRTYRGTVRAAQQLDNGLMGGAHQPIQITRAIWDFECLCDGHSDPR